MRIYDPRVGRFLSTDPITKDYPELTPYQFASNSPISGIDQDGLEYVFYKMVRNNATSQFQIVKTGEMDYGNWALNLLHKTTGWTPDYFRTPVLEYLDGKHYLFSSEQEVMSLKPGDARFNPDKTYTLEGIGALYNVTDAVGGVMVGTGSRSSNSPKEVETPPQATNNQTTAAHSGNNNASQANTASSGSTTSTGKGMNNPKVQAAVNLGNRVHYDQLNGGSAGSVGLPSELSARYPNTQFRFTPRGAKGADVEVVGGTHPSQYPNSTWASGSNFGDFKPGNASGNRTFKADIKSKKLPANTQQLKYDPVTGNLQ